MTDLMGYPKANDEEKINSHYQRLLKLNVGVNEDKIEDVKDNPHDKPEGSNKPTGPMKGELMNWTQMLEAMDDIMNSADKLSVDEVSVSSIEDEEPDPDAVGDDDLIAELDKQFTPVLIMQGIEKDISDQINEAYSEASVLNEKTMITFDDADRMAQLISICALLISRKKNTQKYQMYANAAKIKNQMKLEIQKEEYAAAKALAQKYLVKVSTTNNSSVARDAANELLPQTQH